MYAGPGGSVQGGCLVGIVCQATSASGLGGGSAPPGLQQLLSALGQLARQLMKSSGGGDSGSGSSPTPAAPTGCATYTMTSDPSQIGINPCVYYVPSSASQITTGTTGTTGTADTAAQLLQSLSGGGSTSAASTPSLSVIPQSGTPPLAVTFTTNAIDSTQSYTINFGDGSTPQALSSGSCNSSLFAACTYGANYTYINVGTYTASTAYPGREPNFFAAASVTARHPSGNRDTTGAGVHFGRNDFAGFLTQLLSIGDRHFRQYFPHAIRRTIFASDVNARQQLRFRIFWCRYDIRHAARRGRREFVPGRPWANNFLSVHHSTVVFRWTVPMAGISGGNAATARARSRK